MKKDYFRISEVANLTGVTRQTLIYYDKKDILKPEFIDENNYRYYTITQIHLLQIINMLKEFGTPLKKIKSYLDNRNKEELLELFDDIKEQMLQSIQRTQNYIDVLDYKKSLIEKSIEISNVDNIKVEKREAREVFCGNLLTEEDQTPHGHFINTYNLEKKLKEIDIIGLGLDTITKKSYLTKEYDNQISYFCVNLNTSRADLETKIIPAGLYAVAYHRGSYHTADETYRKLIDYIEKNSLEIDGDSYDVALINYLTEKNSANYLLEISIKVKKQNKKGERI